MPWPTPMHILAAPFAAPRLRISCSRVVMMRAPGAAERVPDRDRATVHVDPLRVKLELVDDGHRLRGERLS